MANEAKTKGEYQPSEVKYEAHFWRVTHRKANNSGGVWQYIHLDCLHRLPKISYFGKMYNSQPCKYTVRYAQTKYCRLELTRENVQRKKKNKEKKTIISRIKTRLKRNPAKMTGSMPFATLAHAIEIDAIKTSNSSTKSISR